jgi:hypothetical protein
VIIVEYSILSGSGKIQFKRKKRAAGLAMLRPTALRK